MTTVAFDGYTLAVDSQVTNLSGTDGNCPECSHQLRHTHRHTMKLFQPRGDDPITFAGETVVAWAGTGSHKLIGVVVRALRRDVDVFESIDMVRMYASNLGDTDIVIVTDVSVWQLTITQKETFTTRVVDFPMAWGSGSPAAALAMSRMGLSAPAAVALAIDSDRYSGGPVRYIHCRSGEPQSIESYTYTEEDILELVKTK